MLSFTKLYLTIHALITGAALVFGIISLKPNSGAKGAWVFFIGVAVVTPIQILWTEYRIRRWAMSYDCTLLETRSVLASRAWVKFGKFWYPSTYVEAIWEE